MAAGCTTNNDCPGYAACKQRLCLNPCAEDNPCAKSALCKVVSHKPVCTCPDGYIGSPETNCLLRKYMEKVFAFIKAKPKILFHNDIQAFKFIENSSLT